MTVDVRHDVQIALLRWIDQGLHMWPQLSRWPLEARGLRDVASRKWREYIVGELWDSAETLPDAYCDLLHMSRGNTYGEAVRKIWRDCFGEKERPVV